MHGQEFHQTVWDDRLRRDWGAILRLAVAEDFGPGLSGDLTTQALVAEDAVGRAGVVARRPGVVAGLPGVEMTLHALDARLRWSPRTEDGRPVATGECVGVVDGPARGIFGAERIVLNLLGRLSGIATLTRRYVDAVAGTKARIFDTRKTTPGWRRLEKYAVRCGGGWNHRGGLDEAVLIKDNHLALAAAGWHALKGRGGSPELDTGCHHALSGRATQAAAFSPAEAVARARRFLAEHGPQSALIVEVEVDTLEQLDAVLKGSHAEHGNQSAGENSSDPFLPDIVLLDNMTPDGLREAVARRDAAGATVELEASGGIDLTTIRAIAEAGVERISVGALTHSAVALDFGLDWD